MSAKSTMSTIHTSINPKIETKTNRVIGVSVQSQYAICTCVPIRPKLTASEKTIIFTLPAPTMSNVQQFVSKNFGSVSVSALPVCDSPTNFNSSTLIVDIPIVFSSGREDQALDNSQVISSGPYNIKFAANTVVTRDYYTIVSHNTPRTDFIILASNWADVRLPNSRKCIDMSGNGRQKSQSGKSRRDRTGITGTKQRRVSERIETILFDNFVDCNVNLM